MIPLPDLIEHYRALVEPIDDRIWIDTDDLMRLLDAIADRNPSGGDVEQAPSLSDESSGGEANRTDNPVITLCNQTTP